MHHRAEAHAGIVYFHQGARSVGEVIDSLMLIHGVLGSDEMAGHLEYL